MWAEPERATSAQPLLVPHWVPAAREARLLIALMTSLYCGDPAERAQAVVVARFSSSGLADRLARLAEYSAPNAEVISRLLRERPTKLVEADSSGKGEAAVDDSWLIAARRATAEWKRDWE